METSAPSQLPYAPIALVGATTLLLEILLTRIFSVTMWYHFAFIAISLALFGLAASGAFVALGLERLQRRPPLPLLAWSCTGFALAIPLALVVSLYLPFPAFVPGAGVTPYAAFAVRFLVLAVPFFFSGLTIALAFTLFPRQVHKVYFADLAGGGLGCALAVPLLNVLSAPGAVVWTACLVFLAAALLFLRGGRRRAGLLAVGALLATAAFVAANERLDVVRVVRVKSYDPARVQEVERPRIYERWHAVSRVAAHPPSVSHNGVSWFYSRPVEGGFPPVVEVTNDAGARTFVYPQLSGDRARRLFATDLSDLAYAVVPAPDVLVIGLGGGKDVVGALALGAKSVTGVELNPLMVDLVQNALGRWSGRPYDDPRVRIAIDEGRNFVASHRDEYDLIKISCTDIWAASVVGAYALTENYLYTREALGDFVGRLTPRGVVSITRFYPQESLRLVRLAATALREAGVANPERHILLAQNGLSMTVLVVRREVGPAESLQFRQRVAAGGHTLVWAPGAAASELSVEPLDEMHRRLLTASDESAAAATGLDLEPPTDDRPFFFNLASLGDAVAGRYASKSGFLLQHGRALSLLVGLLVVSTLVVLLFVLAPLLLVRRGAHAAIPRPQRLAADLFFLALGLGYLLVEIPLVQRLILFLGHPVYALTVALFAMLVSSGLGSVAASRLGARGRDRAGLLMAVAAVAVALAAALLPGLLHALIYLPLGARIVVAMLVVAPIGFLLGMPFPTGLRVVGQLDPSLVPWAWAVNGAASVIAPVIAMLVAIVWGFSAAHYMGAGAYLAAAALYVGVLAPRGTPPAAGDGASEAAFATITPGP
jgi:hypothetical protein